MKTLKRRIPYGISNFEEITSGKYYYIDKTQYIEKIETVNWPIFLRPKRFGKSLLTEMLKWYYDIKAKDKFEQIFGELYIGKHPTGNQNSYFVMMLNFSGMDTFVGSEAELKQHFSRHIVSQFKKFLSYYSEILTIDKTYLSDYFNTYQYDATSGLIEVLRLVEGTGKKLYLCIDEYDSLTNALAIRYRYTDKKDNMYLKILQKGGFFRTFFEELKTATSSIIHQIYITGVLPITISDMKSGYNIATWITFSPEFANMLGITQNELDELLDTIYSDYQVTIDKSQLKETVKQYYNGYRTIKQTDDLYNPMMTLYFFDYVARYDKYPPDLNDKNTRIDYNQIAFLFGQNKDKRDSIIKDITENKQIIHLSNLDVSFDMSDYRDGKYITEGLFYSGILTHGKRHGQLTIPNIVTYDFALQYFEQIQEFEINSLQVNKWLYQYMINGDYKTLLQGFFDDVIYVFPGQFFANANESFYHGLLFHILFNNLKKDTHEILPEYNLPNGRVDIMVRSLPGADVDCEINDLFEVKQVPKNATDAQLKAKFEEGKKEMEQYLTGDYSGWRGIVIAFRGNKDYLTEKL